MQNNNLPPPTNTLMFSQALYICYLSWLSLHSLFITKHDIIWYKCS